LSPAARRGDHARSVLKFFRIHPSCKLVGAPAQLGVPDGGLRLSPARRARPCVVTDVMPTRKRCWFGWCPRNSSPCVLTVAGRISTRGRGLRRVGSARDVWFCSLERREGVISIIKSCELVLTPRRDRIRPTSRPFCRAYVCYDACWWVTLVVDLRRNQNSLGMTPSRIGELTTAVSVPLFGYPYNWRRRLWSAASDVYSLDHVLGGGAAWTIHDARQGVGARLRVVILHTWRHGIAWSPPRHQSHNPIS